MSGTPPETSASGTPAPPREGRRVTPFKLHAVAYSPSDFVRREGLGRGFVVRTEELDELSNYMAALIVERQFVRESEVPYEVVVRDHFERHTNQILSAVELTRDALVDSIKESKEATAVAHKRMEQATAGLADQLDVLRHENEEMRKLLRSDYKARDLFLVSSASCLAFLGALALWMSHAITLVHPFLSAAGLVGSLTFAVLAAWRYRREAGGGR